MLLLVSPDGSRWFSRLQYRQFFRNRSLPHPACTGSIATVIPATVADRGVRRSVGAVLPGPQIINCGAGQLLGGGNQVYIPEVDANWFN